jgi:hypothetical protein
MFDDLAVWSVLVAVVTLFIQQILKHIRLLFGAPSVPVTRVGSDPTTTYYITPAAGLTSLLSAQQRRALWKRAFRRIRRLLRLRILWNRLGIHLQADTIQDLVFGLERRNGVLRRITKAAICQPILEIMSSTTAPRTQVRAVRGRFSRR